jgi:energy-converting hydrogenase Eha subunit A
VRGQAAATDGAATLVQFIIAMAGSGMLVATIQGLFTRRKTRAEVEETGASATKVITDAAAVLVSNVNADNVALRAELTAVRGQLARLLAWQEALERSLEIHERWDAQMVMAIRTCARDHSYPFADIGDPPPLRPTMVRD